MSEIKVNPAILSGFMELLPEDQVRFDRLKEIIEGEFRTYGFWPLDTPAIERCEVLFSKGGGETAKQVYRIDPEAHSVEQALRFDLTVPLARYVALHSSELAFPFRRYQIAKVYRGERSQKGRYREFYQCDIDIIGRDRLSVDNDAEIASVIYRVFKRIGITGVTFCINNRRLLNGFFRYLQIEDTESVLRAIDKRDKIGDEGVAKILAELGLSEDVSEEIFGFLSPRGSNDRTFAVLRGLADQIRCCGAEGPESESLRVYEEGVDELERVYRRMQLFGVPEENIRIDLSITRGLDYYTGTVFETFLNGYESVGSVCSGGRYDDLASNFTKEHLPGIGLSIGLTRLFYQLDAAGLLPEDEEYLKAVVLPMSADDTDAAVAAVNALRDAGIRSQIYLEGGKVKKKFGYADRVKAAFAVMIGESERESGTASVKNLRTGEQESVALRDLAEFILAR